MSKLNTQTFKQLQEADWDVIGQQLLAFAIYWAKRYQWDSGTFDILPQGNSLFDIVQQVIVKTIDGRRKWNPAKGELVPWLRDQIKSEIDALAKSASHRREMTLTGPEESSEIQDRIEQRAVDQGVFGNPRPQNPETIILEQEEKRMVDQKVTAIFQAVSEIPVLEEVLQAIMNGCEPKPRHLAEYLAIPVKDVYNRIRRIQRRSLNFIGGNRD